MEILNLIEEQIVEPSDSWFFHSTGRDLDKIQKILAEGIICTYLRNTTGRKYAYNGKYYISLSRKSDNPNSIYQKRKDSPMFIIDGINPFYADITKNKTRKIFINTRIPLRTSEWYDEYHQYLKIESSKIVAIRYDISDILDTEDDKLTKEKLLFLQNLIQRMIDMNKDLPLYDLASNREINKEKTLSLHL